MNNNIDIDGVVVYSDGSCIGNPGPGGFFAVLFFKGDRHEVFGKWKDTTNNQMELMAVIQSLIFIEKNNLSDQNIVFYCDSQYVLNGVSKFLENRKKNGRRLANKQPVKNVQMWQKLDILIQGKNIERNWTKGHASDYRNNYVDKKARALVA